MKYTEFTSSELKTIIACLRGYRIPGSERLADKITKSLLSYRI